MAHVTNQLCQIASNPVAQVDFNEILSLEDIDINFMLLVEQYYKEEQFEHCKKCNHKILIQLMHKVFSKLDLKEDINVSQKLVFIFLSLRNCLETISKSDLFESECQDEIEEMTYLVEVIRDHFSHQEDNNIELRQLLHYIFVNMLTNLHVFNDVMKRSKLSSEYVEEYSYDEDIYADGTKYTFKYHIEGKLEIWDEYLTEIVEQNIPPRAKVFAISTFLSTDTGRRASPIYEKLAWNTQDFTSGIDAKEYCEAFNAFVKLYNRVEGPTSKAVEELDTPYSPSDVNNIYDFSIHVLNSLQEVVKRITFGADNDNNGNLNDIQEMIHEQVVGVRNVLHGLCYNEIPNTSEERLLLLLEIQIDLESMIRSYDYVHGGQFPGLLAAISSLGTIIKKLVIILLPKGEIVYHSTYVTTINLFHNPTADNYYNNFQDEIVYENDMVVANEIFVETENNQEYELVDDDIMEASMQGSLSLKSKIITCTSEISSENVEKWKSRF